MRDDFSKLKGMYGNVVKYKKSGNAAYKPHNDAFWKHFNRIKKQDHKLANSWLQKIEKHYGDKVESRSKTETTVIATALKNKQNFGWKKARYLGFLLFDNQCACCGVQAPNTHITMDHIKPRSKYPELATDLRNLQPLCHDCNVAKCSWDMTDWRTNEQKFKAIHIMHFPQAIHHYIKDCTNVA